MNEMQKTHKVIGLICCRGGSKGIPGKNIKPFAGRPLLAWILDAARKAAVFDEVILSTDDEAIAAVGREHGARVPGLRPAELARDTSDQFDTHKYIFELLGVTDETHRVCILNNNPFIDSGLIRAGYELAESVEFARVVLDSVRVGGDFLYFRQSYEDEGVLRLCFPRVLMESQINRQSSGPTYVTINNVRWAKPSALTSYDAYKRAVVRHGVAPVWLPKTRNFDLDDLEDWEIAEAVFKALDLGESLDH